MDALDKFKWCRCWFERHQCVGDLGEPTALDDRAEALRSLWVISSCDVI